MLLEVSRNPWKNIIVSELGSKLDDSMEELLLVSNICDSYWLLLKKKLLPKCGYIRNIKIYWEDLETLIKMDKTYKLPFAFENYI